MEEKIKEYQFDSLIYRYIRARENMARYEYIVDQHSDKYKKIDFTSYQNRARRDILRFIDILNDTIGEHR